MKVSLMTLGHVVYDAIAALADGVVTGPGTAQEWRDLSPKDQVEFIGSLTLHLMNPGATAHQRHHLWADQMLQDGWKHGAELSSERKENPFIVPFGDLPPEERAKYQLVAGIIESLREFL